MFKIPDSFPSIKASPEEWTDYAEYQAMKQGKIGFRDITRRSSLINDEIIVNGIEDESDYLIDKQDDIATEVERRRKNCRGNYPFALTNKDNCLEFLQAESIHSLVYKFLLFATRLDMKSNRVFNAHDGAFLFELLSSEIAVRFFGKNAMSEILGTSNVGGFREKLESVLIKIGEGHPIHPNEKYKPQDDKVDLIVWKGFSDKRPSQFLGFGQCKTGTSWADSLGELDPIAFTKTWFTRQLVVNPVKLFFCAQYFPNDIWHIKAYNAGLVFDRFRIIDYLDDELSVEVTEKIHSWCQGVEQRYFS